MESEREFSRIPSCTRGQNVGPRGFQRHVNAYFVNPLRTTKVYLGDELLIERVEA